MKFECDGGKIGSSYGDQQVVRECYLTRPSSWKGEKPDQRKIAGESKTTKYVKSQVDALRMVVERPQMQVAFPSKPSNLSPGNKRKYMSVKDETPSS